jgi:hypothetical protein
LVSNEHQQFLAQQGISPAVQTPGVIQSFGTGVSQLKDKHLQAYFFNRTRMGTLPETAGEIPVYSFKDSDIIGATLEQVAKKDITEEEALNRIKKEYSKLFR